MGRLLSSAIKMQGGAPATATINFTAGAYTYLYINDVFIETLPFGNSTRTINAGDTFYIGANWDFDYVNINYVLNGSFVATYSDYEYVQTPTFTAAGGNTYLFDTYVGF